MSTLEEAMAEAVLELAAERFDDLNEVDKAWLIGWVEESKEASRIEMD